MSAVKERSGGSGSKFIYINGGNIVYWEDKEKLACSGWRGFIKEINVMEAKPKKGDPYQQLQLFIEDQDGVSVMCMPLFSGYGQAFFALSWNIDYSKEVEISASLAEVNGKKKASLFIRQDDKNIKWYFTKDSAAGKKMPQAVKETIGKGKNAKIAWDFSERNDFIEAFLCDQIFKKIQKAWPKGIDKAAKPSEKKKEEEPDITEPLDDLPF